MAKKKPAAKKTAAKKSDKTVVQVEEPKPFCRAIVDCGNLRWEYRHPGAKVEGRMSHDEDVSDFSQEDIIDLTRSMLGLAPEETVEVVYA